MKNEERSNERGEDKSVWFRVYFDQQGEFHHNKEYCIATTLAPRVARLVFQLDKYPFASRPSKGHKVVDF